MRFARYAVVLFFASAVAAAAGAARERGAEADWKRAFGRVYRLVPGQAVKRVAPPYIPERFAFCSEGHLNQGKDAPTHLVLHAVAGGDVCGWGHSFADKLALRQVLGFALQMKKYEIDGPADLLSLDLMGDWVVDPDAPRERQLADVTWIVLAAHRRLVRFERREVEREVIVARGRFAFTPLPNARQPRFVYLFTGLLDPAGPSPEEGDAAAFFRALGGYAGLAVVDETQAPNTASLEWSGRISANVADRKPAPQRDTGLRELLDNVSRQTGLTFEKGRRKIPVWIAVEGPAAG